VLLVVVVIGVVVNASHGSIRLSEVSSMYHELS
jgi:hypothetical protein